MNSPEAWRIVALDIAWFARWPILCVLWAGFGNLTALEEKERARGFVGVYPDHAAFLIAFIYTVCFANWWV